MANPHALDQSWKAQVAWGVEPDWWLVIRYKADWIFIKLFKMITTMHRYASNRRDELYPYNNWFSTQISLGPTAVVAMAPLSRTCCVSCATALALQLRTQLLLQRGVRGDIACFFPPYHAERELWYSTLMSKILKLNTPKRYPGGVNFGVPS